MSIPYNIFPIFYPNGEFLLTNGRIREIISIGGN